MLSETLLRLPWDNWDSYEVGLQEHPILTKTSINVGIYLIGDWLAQVLCPVEVFLRILKNIKNLFYVLEPQVDYSC